MFGRDCGKDPKVLSSPRMTKFTSAVGVLCGARGCAEQTGKAEGAAETLPQPREWLCVCSWEANVHEEERAVGSDSAELAQYRESSRAVAVQTAKSV